MVSPSCKSPGCSVHHSNLLDCSSRYLTCTCSTLDWVLTNTSPTCHFIYSLQGLLNNYTRWKLCFSAHFECLFNSICSEKQNPLNEIKHIFKNNTNTIQIIIKFINKTCYTKKVKNSCLIYQMQTIVKLKFFNAITLFEHMTQIKLGIDVPINVVPTIVKRLLFLQTQSYMRWLWLLYLMF